MSLCLAAPFLIFLGLMSQRTGQPQSKDKDIDRFIVAVVAGDQDEVRRLLEAGVSPNARDGTYTDDTALGLACHFSRRSVVALLVKKGADPSASNAFGWTPLMRAIKANNIAIVEDLLETKPDLKKKTQSGWTALMLAQLDDSTSQIERMLVTKGAPPSSKDQVRQKLAAIHATCEGDEKSPGSKRYPGCQTCRANSSLETLLSNKSLADSADSEGNSCLIYATNLENMKRMRLLIETGAKVNAANQFGESPLFFAVKSGNRKCVQYLIEKGADVNQTNYSRTTPIIIAAELGSTAIATDLLDRGAKINQTANGRVSALIWAAWNGHDQMVRLLLDRGADAQTVTEGGKTALAIAREKGFSKIVRMLSDP